MSTRFEIPDWLLPAEASPLPPVDDLRVEGLVNRFIDAKQQALFTAPDAFYRQEGGDALAAESALAQRLQGLRTTVLDLADNDGERAALGPRLDAHIEEAMDGIGRHVEAQRKVFQRRTVAERQALIRRAAELEPDNDDKIAGLAEAHASAAQELARLDGLAAGSVEEAEALNAARSQILSGAIAQRIAANKPAQAVALYERVKAALGPADRRALEVPIGVAADDAATDAWLERESGADGAALVERVGLDNALPEQQRYILWAKIAARESADESRRFATVKGLDDRLAKATVTIATQPALYKTGTLAAIANAYEAAGAADQAAETRRLALLEPLFRPFAQLGIAAQRRHLDTFAGPEHTMAEAIMRHQADAFARDPYAAGIALYPELGPSPPAQDADGRLAQIRMIEARRGTPASVAEPGAMTKVQADATEKGVLQNRPTWTDGASRSRDGGTDAAGIPSAPSADGAPDDVQLSQAKRPQAKRPPKNETGEAAIASPQQPAERQQASVEAFALEAERRAMKWVDLIYGQPNTSNQKLLPDDWQQTTNPQYVEWMRDAAEQHGVPLELLARHLYKESTFNPKAQNGDHKGLGQLGPSAIAAIGIKGTFDYFDAKSSIYASAAYLNLLHRQMKSWPAAIAAYNAGPTIVGAWLNNKSTRFSKAKPPYEPNEETQEAIRHVFRGDPRAFGE